MTTPWTSLLWFGVILALIPATLWFIKSTPLGGAGGAGVMKSIAVLPLSTSQRIVTLEVGQGDERRWLLIGVTPSSITTLHTMAPMVLEGGATPAPGAVHPAFAQVLGRLTGKPGRSDSKDGDAG